MCRFDSYSFRRYLDEDYPAGIQAMFRKQLAFPIVVIETSLFCHLLRYNAFVRCLENIKQAFDLFGPVAQTVERAIV